MNVDDTHDVEDVQKSSKDFLELEKLLVTNLTSSGTQDK